MTCKTLKLGVASVAALLTVGTLAGCSDGKTQRNLNVDADSGSDTTQNDVATDGGQDTGLDTDQTSDTTELRGEAGRDGGDVSDTGPTGPAPSQGQQLCTAGGVGVGGGVKLIHCTGPAEITGQNASGDGVQLQSGSLRLITE